MIGIPSFHVVGLSHHTAGIAARERLSLAADEIVRILADEARAGRPGVILSTCNRCEYYWTGGHDGVSWFAELARTRGVTDLSAVRTASGEAAVRHLFQVAAGLDSQIVGETEILGQVRRAHELARQAGASSRELAAIFAAAVAAGRRVRRDTPLGRHPSSVSDAAIGLAVRQLGVLAGRATVVLGAGEAARGALRALREQGADRVVVVNRRLERAEAAARAVGVEAAPWSALDDLLAGADLVVTATAAKRPVLTAERLARALNTPERGERALWVLDLAVPRNVDVAARDVAGVKVFDLDDLQERFCPATSPAEEPALVQAQRILDAEVERLACTFRGRAAATQLARLHRMGAEVVEEETARLLAQLGPVTDAEREAVRRMAERVVRRVLYPVSRAVRGAGGGGR